MGQKEGTILNKINKYIIISILIFVVSSYDYSAATISLVNTVDNQTKVSGVEAELRNSDDEIIDVSTSNQFGEIKFEDVETGIYNISISSVPISYQDFQTNFQVVVNDKNQYLTLENNLVYRQGTIKITRYSTTGEAIFGSELTIYDENNNVVDVITTDENGFAESKNLKDGKYYVKETKAATGYILDPTVYTVYVNKDIEAITYDTESQPISYSYSLHVVDQYNNDASAANYQLSSGNGEIIELTTNEEGYITISNLIPGTYTLQHTGYDQYTDDVSNYTITVGSDGNVSGVGSEISVIRNDESAVEEKSVLAETGNNSFIGLILTISVLVLLKLGIYRSIDEN